MKLFIALMLSLAVFGQDINQKFDVLLKKYVKNGSVDYKGLKNEENSLNLYLNQMAGAMPAAKQEQLAYYINLYNAATIKMILNHYGKIKSIKDINQQGKNAWDIPFIKIGSKTITLNDIEHNIIRKQFNDARIHFALVCAAKSCPPLRAEVYTASKLDEQLNDQGKIFMNDPTKNKISKTKAEVSALFDWYSSDFKLERSIWEWVNTYSKTKISQTTPISFKKYDWSMNGKF